jgi:antitoxin VapB
MIHLTRETEALARQLAAAHGIPLEQAVKQAIEESARSAGIARPRRRLTVDQMLAVGDEMAALPLLDTRSPQAIVDDVNV